jgi:hypothetical protein
VDLAAIMPVARLSGRMSDGNHLDNGRLELVINNVTEFSDDSVANLPLGNWPSFWRIGNTLDSGGDGRRKLDT